MSSETSLLNPYALYEYVTGERVEWEQWDTAEESLRKIARRLGLGDWEDLLTDDPSESILTAFTRLGDSYDFGTVGEAFSRYNGPRLKLDDHALQRLLSVLVRVKELEQPGGNGEIVLPDAELFSPFPDAQLVVKRASYIDPLQGLSTTCTVLASLIAINWCDDQWHQRLASGLSNDRELFGWQFLTAQGGVKEQIETSTKIYRRRQGTRAPLFATSADNLEQWPALMEKASIRSFRRVVSDAVLVAADYAQFSQPPSPAQVFPAGDRLPEIVLRALWGTRIEQDDVASSDVVGKLVQLASEHGGVLDRPVIAETVKGRKPVNRNLFPLHCYAVLGVIGDAIVVRDPYGKPSKQTVSLTPLQQPLEQRAQGRSLVDIAKLGVRAVPAKDFEAAFRSVYFA